MRHCGRHQDRLQPAADGSANAQSTTLVNGIKLAITEVGGKVGDYTIQYEDWDDARRSVAIGTPRSRPPTPTRR